MSSANKKKFSTGLIVSLFVLFFLILRGYGIEHSSLWIDEGYSINASLSILEKGVPILDSESFYRQGILYNYISAGLMALFGFDAFSPTTARIPALFFGILSIFSLFLLAKKLFNRNIALLSSLLLGFSTWHIAWSQQARGYTGLMFFTLLSFYFLYIFLEDRKPFALFFFTLSFLCAYLSHTIAFIFIPSFLIIFIAHTILNSKSSNIITTLKSFITKNNSHSEAKGRRISLHLKKILQSFHSFRMTGVLGHSEHTPSCHSEHPSRHPEHTPFCHSEAPAEEIPSPFRPPLSSSRASLSSF